MELSQYRLLYFLHWSRRLAITIYTCIYLGACISVGNRLGRFKCPKLVLFLNFSA